MNSNTTGQSSTPLSLTELTPQEKKLMVMLAGSLKRKEPQEFQQLTVEWAKERQMTSRAERILELALAMNSR